jgi:hypothetical protein
MRIKKRTDIALVDIKNIAEPTPISLVKEGILFEFPQHIKQALLPS